MIKKQQLIEMAQEQLALQQLKQGDKIQRDTMSKVEQYLPVPHTIIVTGIRRGGKSTLTQQIKEAHFPENAHQFTFEDERLVDFNSNDFALWHEALIEMNGDQKTFFLDEIQNILNWELFVRRLMNQGYKFIITGSNASMLSQELGTRLTGRNVEIELFPFSFCEFLRERKYKIDRKTQHTAQQKAILSKLFKEYLLYGGMPEYLEYGDPSLITKTYEDILYRDIITRYGIKDIAAFKRLALYLFNHYSAKITFSSLKPLLNIKNTSTVSNYFHYLENSYLIFVINQFSFSLKQQQLLPKKVYVIDNGMAKVLSMQASPNWGRLLENLVFIELKRRYSDIFYFETAKGLEVDFCILKSNKPILLIQVVYELQNPKTRQRELKALTEAMTECGLKEGWIISFDTEETFVIGKHKIHIIPCTKWLLG